MMNDRRPRDWGQEKKDITTEPCPFSDNILVEYSGLNYTPDARFLRANDSNGFYKFIIFYVAKKL